MLLCISLVEVWDHFGTKTYSEWWCMGCPQGPPMPNKEKGSANRGDYTSSRMANEAKTRYIITTSEKMEGETKRRRIENEERNSL